MFNWVIAVLIVAGVAVVVVPAWELWGLWFRGRPVDDLTLYGDVPVLVWGRIGKVLQFAAGLAVVIDLLDADRLRARGQRAAERLRDRRAQLRTKLRPQRLAALERRLYDSFVDVRNLPGGTLDAAVSLNTRPPTDFGQDAPFTHEDYLAFRERVLAGLDVGRNGALSRKQTLKIHHEVAAFFQDRLPPRDRASYEQGERKWGRSFVVVGVALLGSVAYHLTTVPPLEWMFLHGVLMAAFFTIMSPVGPYVAALPGLARETPALVAGHLATHLLHRARPLHAFRKIALVLFVVGFGLDLLAS
ncbi:MAG TPA: hypothetical protein VFV66_10055 [Nonomuraea sp.]|nr:hypothetical protein [Nonomuraea sp.]